MKKTSKASYFFSNIGIRQSKKKKIPQLASSQVSEGVLIVSVEPTFTGHILRGTQPAVLSLG